MRKKVKAVLAAKDCAVKTSASGVALTKLLDAIDDAAGEQIFSELRKMRSQSIQCAQAYRGYANKIPEMVSQIETLKKEIHRLTEERNALLAIPDETIRNAVELYSSIAGTYNARMNHDTNTANEITIAYLQSRNAPEDAIAEVESEVSALAD